MTTWIEFFEPAIEVALDELLGLNGDPELVMIQSTLAIARLQIEMSILSRMPYTSTKRPEVVGMELVGSCRERFAQPNPGVEEVLYVLDKILLIRASEDIIAYKSSRALEGIKERTALENPKRSP